ncbi:LOB domain-containing protein 20 [Apostasia shenzhenica]|uniref:LOB domain-containing protein 20 n=1 Tax=Apostasia shenzhenica TaxID=1088818 RepID=A0A2I0A5U7_9ASPA|nr:LOB domain-containing protein 20 [Apostasia shenzhenica]
MPPSNIACRNDPSAGGKKGNTADSNTTPPRLAGAAATAGRGSTVTGAPCGACKFLRRKCASGCVFAAHFGNEQSAAARFAAVHKVFGASNVSKLLKKVPPARRHDAVATVSYEAQARLSDPVLGCVATVLALQHQVMQLQAELSIVQSQLINSRLAAAGAMRYSAMPQQGLMVVRPPAPAFSNSSESINNMNSKIFSLSSLEYLCDARGLELLQLPQTAGDDGEGVEWKE